MAPHGVPDEQDADERDGKTDGPHDQDDLEIGIARGQADDIFGCDRLRHEVEGGDRPALLLAHRTTRAAVVVPIMKTASIFTARLPPPSYGRGSRRCGRRGITSCRCRTG